MFPVFDWYLNAINSYVCKLRVVLLSGEIKFQHSAQNGGCGICISFLGVKTSLLMFLTKYFDYLIFCITQAAIFAQE